MAGAEEAVGREKGAAVGEGPPPMTTGVGCRRVNEERGLEAGKGGADVVRGEPKGDDG